MQSGDGSRADAEPITAINITPLVDVSLVLVIIFMVTMPFLVEKSLKIKASSEHVVKTSSITEPILVEISDTGVTVESRRLSLAELAPALARIIKERSNSRVAVSADRRVPHGRIVDVLDQVVESGALELNLLQPRKDS